MKQGLEVIVGQRMSEEAYQRFVLSTMEARWKLHDGVLVEKPGRTWNHSSIVTDLGFAMRSRHSRHSAGCHDQRGRTV